ncbi:hypothetical protein RHGRI_017123 [Rhododendron griersonianum]|uniref:Uncharacterized protein n=1 Tax=Rhododendron griersonianum TaxID=479676 RepID=A0AAV6JWQ9_9ERIC|nr:hypothetical protein RHGRI_017123 [Rhododendron griersonianum]
MAFGKIGTSGGSPVLPDTESQPKEDIVSPSTVKYIAASSVAIGSAVKEDKERLILSSSVPPLENSNGAENDKDQMTTECTDSRLSNMAEEAPWQGKRDSAFGLEGPNATDLSSKAILLLESSHFKFSPKYD